LYRYTKESNAKHAGAAGSAAAAAGGAGGGGGVKGEGFVHYAADVYCQSTQRPGGGGHFDLSFQLFTPQGVWYPFKNCDATGKLAKDKEQHQLRSKVAVGRYLERDGMSEEDLDKMGGEVIPHVEVYTRRFHISFYLASPLCSRAQRL
jgi:hypothetical protein